MGRTKRSASAFGIGRLIRRLHDADPLVFEQPSDVAAPFPIPVIDQPAMVPQQSVLRGRERATDLAHEERVGMRRGPDDLDAARCEVDGAKTRTMRTTTCKRQNRAALAPKVAQATTNRNLLLLDCFG
jgi:hypothetical protein